MKLLLLLTCGLSITSLSHGHGLGFSTNPQEAMARALVYDCPFLVFFTGSDWSPLTHELDVKVWEDPVLAPHLNLHYPMLNMDYPQRVKISDQQRESLRKSLEQHRITHFPTVLALTHDMREVGRLEYRGESAEQVGQHLDSWEDRYAKLSTTPSPASASQAAAPPASPPTKPAAPPSTDLRPGDALPDLSFTASDGQPFQLSQFQGKILLFTFVFTRCPLPDYCPLQSWKFGQVQKILSEDPANTSHWHLLSISIDPRHDTPTNLAKYAAMHGAKPGSWTLATGELSTISKLALGFGADFWEDKDVLITHHMRTILVGNDGKILDIITDKNWKPEDLATRIKALAGRLKPVSGSDSKPSP